MTHDHIRDHVGRGLEFGEATELLRGATITAVEFVTDPDITEDDPYADEGGRGGYVVIRAGSLTLYADHPTVYA